MINHEVRDKVKEKASNYNDLRGVPVKEKDRKMTYKISIKLKAKVDFHINRLKTGYFP